MGMGGVGKWVMERCSSLQPQISFQLGPQQQPAATASHMSEPRQRSGADMAPEDHSLQRDLTAPKSESKNCPVETSQVTCL